jgi:ubiquinone/menaquinone biosynthesis C-methylase UbiE/DNA-binding transcriptional ArsR family regulator
MEAVRYFKTLADETRLRLLNLLRFQEFNVQELTEILDMGQSRISRHLKLLHECGLVASRRDGLWAFYRSVEEGTGRRFNDSIGYLLEQEEIFRTDLEAAEEVLRTGKLRSRRFFDALAPGWETMKRSIIGDFDLVAEIVDLLPRCQSAADLGCGSGTLMEKMVGKADRVIGVDSSREMLTEAARRLNKRTKRFDLRIGELEHLPLGDGEAHSAVINLVLHHLRTPVEGLLEAFRVLRQGGALVVADFYKHEEELLRKRYGDRWLGFSPTEIEEWLNAAGFSIEEQRLFPVQMGLKVFVYLCLKKEETKGDEHE